MPRASAATWSRSPPTRQFLQLMEKPDVDLIEGLSPAISIEQKATSHNPRSTVGTVTEIHDYLRLLYARAGTPYCPDHNLPLQAQSVSQMVDAALALPEDTRLMILAPVVVDRKGEHSDLFDSMQAQGFVRFRIRSGGGTAHEAEAKVYEVDQLPKLKKTEKHSIDVVVDRVKVRADIKQRLAESFETALRLADGRALALEMDSGKEHTFSSRFACPICSYSLQELEPRLFSFNNPMGACPSCDGLGQITFFDPKRVVAFPNLSLASGAIKGWTAATSSTSRCCKAWRRTTTSTPTPRSRTCPKRCSRWCCTARASRKSRSPISTSAAAPRCASMCSKGSFPTWNAATARPIPLPCARNWPSTRTTSPARPATARGCAPRRATSSWARASRRVRSSRSTAGRCAMR
ncbi:protein of unknown function [Cupriavidus taiwanensis]|nr:protein of unknown function [Cupriavidus taiwanensis]